MCSRVHSKNELNSQYVKLISADSFLVDLITNHNFIVIHSCTKHTFVDVMLWDPVTHSLMTLDDAECYDDSY